MLKNLNIDFAKNKTTLIVGPSGSGKSTLIDIILKFRTPDKGHIFWIIPILTKLEVMIIDPYLATYPKILFCLTKQLKIIFFGQKIKLAKKISIYC